MAAERGDARSDADPAQRDASAACDPTGMFDAPVPLTGFATAANEGVPRLTGDELELYFNGQFGTATNQDIYRAQRSSLGEPFGPPVAVAPVNTTANEFNPSISSDGLILFFESPRDQGSRLYAATRSSRLGEFDKPFLVANVNSATVSDTDAQPFVTADGQELWFVSNRVGSIGSFDIFRATGNGSSFADPGAGTAVNSTASDFVPALSTDKLTIYFSSLRGPSGKTDYDIWTAHRSTTRDGFPEPVPVGELNSIGNDFVGWLSPDNCRLYFTSNAAGTHDLYVATRHPR